MTIFYDDSRLLFDDVSGASVLCHLYRATVRAEFGYVIIMMEDSLCR